MTAVNTPFYETDFSGAALPAGWTALNSPTSDFSGPSLVATFSAAGKGYWMPAPAGDFSIEVKISGYASGTMIGPWIADDTGAGVQGSWYTGPVSWLTLSMSGWLYDSSFTQGPNQAAADAIMRLTKSGGKYSTAYSTDDGATWSRETPLLSRAFTPTRIGFGSILGADTITVSKFTVRTAADLVIDSPEDIPGLRLWLSADDLDLADGATVTEWSDLSAAANSPTSVVGAPVFEAAGGVGGGPCVRFPIGSYLQMPNLMSGLTRGEIASTRRANNAAAVQGSWDFGAQSADPYNHWPFSNGAIYEDFGAALRYSFNPTLSLTSWRRYSVDVDAGFWRACLDEAVQLEVNSPTVGWTTTPRIGNNVALGTEPLRYGAVLLYSRKLAIHERGAVARWLTDHPSGGAVPVPVPAPSGGAVTWFDGDSAEPATVQGWWDGSVIQPVEALGWWDGSAIQALVSGNAELLDGGAPDTTVWARTFDGGTPSTTTWTDTIDGGTP